MGDAADLLYDQLIDAYEDLQEEFINDLYEKKWRTNTNKTIHVPKMEDSHIINARNYLQREKDFMFREEWIGIFDEEIKREE